jgi:hypothetical protein
LSQRGSLSVLVAGYLALILYLVIGGSALALSLISQNRIQGVVDSALLYGHDKAQSKGLPNQGKLEDSIIWFLETAPSAKQLQILSVSVSVSGRTSSLELCAEHRDLMGWFPLGRICKISRAESFLTG